MRKKRFKCNLKPEYFYKRDINRVTHKVIQCHKKLIIPEVTVYYDNSSGMVQCIKIPENKVHPHANPDTKELCFTQQEISNLNIKKNKKLLWSYIVARISLIDICDCYEIEKELIKVKKLEVL